VRLESGIQGAAFHRGAATIYNGKVFRVIIDDHVLALDLKTGEQLWNQKFADLKDGYYATGGPIIANGVLISGVSGGESTTRGFLDGWDPDTGKKLWRQYPFQPPASPVPRRGQRIVTPGRGAEVRRGGAVRTIPNSDLIYWDGQCGAEPYDRESLDSLITSSVLAIQAENGGDSCYFQYTPNDVYDVDATDENVLADIPSAT
jgi:alcohol dehydrogenase (cytochrome c)